MERYMFDEKNGLWYELVGDFYLPCVTAPEMQLGRWGQFRRHHLKEHQNGIYTGMLLSGKLENHLAEVDAKAEEMFKRLVAEISEAEGVNEEMKAVDQLAWVQQMNSIRSKAAEIVREELIFA